MTIVAFHYTDSAILAMTDGLISRDGKRVIDENVKIFAFTPRYKVPQISMGRLNGFTEYLGGPFCIAYAGNYTLVATVLAQISTTMSRQLVISRDDTGKPTICKRSDEGEGLYNSSYWDDFNFRNDELIDLSINLVANIISKLLKKACLDFSRNAMTNPSIQLLIFGQELIKHSNYNRAQFMSCNKCENENPEIIRYSVMPWSFFCFGEQDSSEKLRQQFDNSAAFNSEQLTSDQAQASGAWGSRSTALRLNEGNRHEAIKQAIFKLIARGTETIGGSCTIAESTLSGSLHAKTIGHDSVVHAISD